MILKLLVKNGPLAGKQFDLKAGAIIGRSSTDISLDDAKMSGRHAKIETDPAGRWIMLDLGSTNGLKVNGKRLAQVSLTPGLVIHVGNTDLEVISAADPAIATPNKQAKAPPPPANPATPEKEKTSIESVDLAPTSPQDEPIVTVAPTWSEYMASFSTRAQAKVLNQIHTLKPFDPLLVLTVERGPQIGTTWVLGYGPRNIGLDSVDLPLLDPQAPGIAFMVTPRGAFAYFETLNAKKVRLNNKSVSAETLRGDDKITVGDTVIHVSYRE
jgi:predicted component of type VI protein secretion system